MADEIVLRMDRVSAKHLADMLHNVGEHLAAGQRIEPMDPDESQRLGRVLHDLWAALDADSGAQAGHKTA
ncbi:hypothetical protein D7147_31045 [Micromonospora musae]|uniref:Uncharacterized protein n=1 Tax=Micromonospora musae TaxID=1894970 RepID=A0ABX9QT34_9ACTN|nr:hypothetical protein [Micromonospora musae]RKN13568.1 hypothetical protein D7147_31045 [Micromonospora musae]